MLDRCIRKDRCGRLDAARARAARREPVARRKPSKPRKPSPLTNGLPLYSTDWNVGSSPRDPLHDRSFAAVYAANHRAVSRSAGVGLHLLNLQRYLRGEVLSQRAVSRRRARVRVRLAWRQAGADHPPVRGARRRRARDASSRELVNRPLAGQPIIVSGWGLVLPSACRQRPRGSARDRPPAGRRCRRHARARRRRTGCTVHRRPRATRAARAR